MLFSLVTFINAAPHVFSFFASQGFSRDAYCDADSKLWSPFLHYWSYLFYLSKYYEILDTVIILLKGWYPRVFGETFWSGTFSSARRVRPGPHFHRAAREIKVLLVRICLFIRAWCCLVEMPRCRRQAGFDLLKVNPTPFSLVLKPFVDHLLTLILLPFARLSLIDFSLVRSIRQTHLASAILPPRRRHIVDVLVHQVPDYRRLDFRLLQQLHSLE